MREFSLLVDGVFRPSSTGATFEPLNPSTGEPCCTVADASTEDMAAAVGAARHAFENTSWATQSRESRIREVRVFLEALTAALPDLSEWETRDAGHTARLAGVFTVPVGIEQARAAVELYEQKRDVEPLPQISTPEFSHNYARREPIGVCSIISPFNFPVLVTMWKLPHALVTGNTVVLKPSPLAPATLSIIGEVAQQTLPPGVLNVVPTTSIGAAEVLTTHPDVDRVAFTGSTETGRRIMRGAAETVKRLTLELGGKGATILLDDADVEHAVRGALWACMFHQGQSCESGTRLLVPESMYDDVVALLVEIAERLVVGPADDYASDLGPLISAAQLDRVQRYVKLGQDQGARLVTGGHVLTEGLPGGYYHQPTIFTDVTNDMTIAQEEIFGPVLCVIPYDGDSDAVRIANDSIYGLACSVWSNDVPRAAGVAHRLRSGTVWINDHHLISGYAPFGGYKQSGFGRELGTYGLDEFTEVKHVHIDQTTGLADKYWYGVLGLDE